MIIPPLHPRKLRLSELLEETIGDFSLLPDELLFRSLPKAAQPLSEWESWDTV